MVPGPTNVPLNIMRAMQKPIINHRGPEFRELYKRLLENLKYAFKTKNDVFPLTCSGTGGVECSIANVISPGDKVVIPINGVFSERMREEIVQFGGAPVEIPVEWGSACSANEIESTVETEKDIKAIALVYNETSTGTTLRDLPEIGKIAKKYDKLLIVDAVSILAGDHLPVDEWNIDICVAGSQKCLACPPGLALVSVSEKAYEVIAKNKHRSPYFDLVKCRESKKNLETPFTPALPLFYALDEALKMLMKEGLENRIHRHRVCAEAFYNAFEAAGLKMLAKEEFRSNTVIAVWKPEKIDEKKFRDLLREKYRVSIAGGMGKLKGHIVRIGSMGIVAQREVLTTVEAMLKALKDLNYEEEINLNEIISKTRGILSKI
jgi:aspartate aminotransferase-like enzyme